VTIHLSISFDLEVKPRERAAAAGKDLETFALDALREVVAGSNGSSAPTPLTREQRVKEWLSWTASHSRTGNIVDDSRESIYAGRGE